MESEGRPTVVVDQDCEKEGESDDESTPFMLKASPTVRLNQSKVHRAVKTMEDEEARRNTVTFGDRVFALIKLSIPVTIAGSWSFCVNFILPHNPLVAFVHAVGVTFLILAALYLIVNHPQHEDFDTTMGKFYKLGGMTFGMMVSWAWTDFFYTTSSHFIDHGKHAMLLGTNQFLRDFGYRVLFGVIVVACAYAVSYTTSKHVIEDKGASFGRTVWILLETALICPVAWSLNDILRFFALHYGNIQPVLWTKCLLNLVLCPFLLQLMSMDIRCFNRGQERSEATKVQINQRKFFWRGVMGAIVAWSILDACDATLDVLRRNFSTASYVGFNLAHTAIFTVLAIGFAAVSGKFKFTEQEGLKVYTFETITMTIGMSFGWSWRDLNKNILSATLKPTDFGGYAKALPFASAVVTTALGVWILLQLVPKNAEIDSSYSDSFDEEDAHDCGRDVKDIHALVKKKHHHIHSRGTTLPGLRVSQHKERTTRRQPSTSHISEE